MIFSLCKAHSLDKQKNGKRNNRTFPHMSQFLAGSILFGKDSFRYAFLLLLAIGCLFTQEMLEHTDEFRLKYFFCTVAIAHSLTRFRSNFFLRSVAICNNGTRGLCVVNNEKSNKLDNKKSIYSVSLPGATICVPWCSFINYLAFWFHFFC